jgi:tetratricopeptide (TPR) repeat protein
MRVHLGFALLLSATIALPCAAQQFDRANSLMNESAAELDRGHFKEGVTLAEQALRTGAISGESYPGLYNNLCVGLTGLQRYEEAIDACNKALELSPRSWSFYNNRGNIYFYQGHYDRALAEYYKAMTFATGTSVLMKNINLTMRKRGIPGAVTSVPEKSS